jgi:SpoVK/Ycf46/Vps4 family AAA+-type ATPase
LTGRENILGENGGGLSFDCLLNSISGVQNSDGVFLIVTTNHVEDLDPALGKPRTDKKVNGSFISTRPGRIDRAFELPVLDEVCRRKIAQRILKDYPEYIEQTVKDCAGDSGAQFQEKCAQIALKNFWDRKDINESKT